MFSDVRKIFTALVLSARGCHRNDAAALLRVSIPVLALLAPWVEAASLPGFPGEQLLNREQQYLEGRERENRSTPEIFFDTPSLEATDSDASPSASCFPINSIVLEGARVLKAELRENLINKHEGRCLGYREINDLVRQISNTYIEKGYVTSRAYLRSQNLTDGVLIISVLEGQLGEITVAVDDPGRINLETAFPGLEGEILNLRDLEQGLEQLWRLPSARLEMDIQPGAAPGDSDLLLKGELAKPWRATWLLDNYGSETTGKYQLSGEIQWDSPLGLNDQITARLIGSTRQLSGKHSRGGLLRYSLPYGYWLFDAWGNYFQYAQTLPTPSQDFISTGSSALFQFNAQRTVSRTQRSKTQLNFNLTKRDISNAIEDVRIYSSSYRLTTLGASLQHIHRFPRSRLLASAGIVVGTDLLGAHQKLTEPDAPQVEFTRVDLELGYSHSWPIAGRVLSYDGVWRGQYSGDYLYSAEQISLGGLFTVRGYEHAISGDSGWYLRNELSLPLWESGASQYANGYLSFDYGEVDWIAGEENLSGVGIGLRAASYGLTFDLSIAQRLTTPRLFADSDDAPVVMAQLSYTL
ncbi:MAG: ShlB/FhaC/HecB family hemolysin secretion/activation protein [Gammaproteobacteria bacterium]|nr:ShlB/FhaC/HecB family hemolysin secretion/activation protein [Gammaproteobacteria bacterium]